MVIRVNENIGTAGADAFTAFGGNAYFGLGGNDRFGIFPWQDGLLVIGGRGADSYFAAGNSVMTVMDVGSSDGDVLNIPGFGFGRASANVALIDGSHLLLSDSQTGSTVIVIDWQSNAGRIETFNTADGALGSGAVAQALAARAVPTVAWEDLGAFGLRPLNTAEMNEAIAFYTNRALELEGLAGNPGNPPGSPPPAPPPPTPGAPAANPLFDSAYYLATYPDVAAAGIDPLQHYRAFGWQESRNPGHCFDTAYYVANNPDVVAAGLNPLDHFYLYGGREGRNPGTNFDSARYLAENPDVAAAGANPLLHFFQFGDAEGRAAFDIFGNVSPCDPTPPTVVPLDFTLGDDDLTGTGGSDTGRALLLSSGGGVRASIGSKDKADFGGGYDTLEASLNGDGEDGQGGGPLPTLLGLEEIVFMPVKGIQGSAAFFDAGGTTGLEKISVVNGASPISIGNVGTLLTGGLTIVSPVTPGTVTVGFDSGATAGTADALTVTIDSGAGLFSTFGAVTVGPDIETVNLVSTGAAANRLDDIVGGTKSLNVNTGGAALTIASDTSHAAVTVTGAHDFTALGELLLATSINAGGLTGRLTINVDDSLAVSVTSGSGDDTVDFSDDQSGYTMSDTWNAGGGIDRIVLRSADLSDGSSSLFSGAHTNLTGVEELEVQDTFVGTADLQYFGAVGIHDYFFKGASGNDILNFDGSANSVTFRADALGDLTLNHVGNGGGDTITFTLQNADVNGVLTFDGFETVRLVSVGGGAAISESLSPFTTSGAFAPVFVSGPSDLALNGASEAQVLNAGAFTGALLMSAFLGTDLSAVPGPAGATITGGSGNDRLVGEASGGRPDTISGGAGNDLIYGGPINFDGGSTGQGDVLTGGGGADVFVFAGEDNDAVRVMSAGTTQITRITDFAAGNDKIALVNTNTSFSAFALDGTQTVASAGNLAAVYAAIAPIAASSGTSLHGALIVVTGGAAAGTYLYVNNDTAGVSATDDMLINLTGLSGSFGAGDVVFSV